jgi:hypothetical protein
MVWHCIYNQHITFRVDLDSGFFGSSRFTTSSGRSEVGVSKGLGCRGLGGAMGVIETRTRLRFQVSPGSGAEVEAEGNNGRSVQRVKS